MNRLKAGTRVKLTAERIMQLDSDAAQRYREREGTVIGYRPGAVGPLVELDGNQQQRREILQSRTRT
jgi:hypothetical protein